MRTLRIFISSPGDVAEERERARQVVQGLRRRYARHFDVTPVFWEDMPLGLETGFQEGIDLLLSRDRGVDVAVFILWSRLGSALGGNFQRPDGRPYRSGTERELDLMLQARAAQDGKRPHIIAYARKDEATFEESLRGTTTTEKQERIRQKELVEAFIREEFHDSDTGTNIRAYHTYNRPQAFSERLRVHLQEVLDGLAGAEIGRPAWEIDERGPPFLGLESFRLQHAEIFFGREDEVSEARLRLAAAARRGTAFLLVGGGSGTGKSSLAAAGIIPDLVANEIDESVSRWLHASFTPAALGGDPALGMARILWNMVPSVATHGEQEAFVKALRVDPALAVSLVLLPALKAEATTGGSVRLVLLVDQLEEVFTDSRLTPEARDQCAAILEALASSGAVWIVATLRSDFYPQLLRCGALVRLKSEGAQLDLVPPGADALRRMIESPALISGLTYEKTGETTLADRILRDVSGQAELLPLLEDLLRELFENRSPAGVLTVAAYESLGGIEGSLAKRAEASLASLPADVQLAFPAVLRKLVASGEGPEGTAVRRRARLDSFADGSPARLLVDGLVSDRLATAAAGDDGTPEVTIAHEAILRVWPRVAAWIEENGEFLRMRDRVTARMREKAPLTAADPLLPAARAILESRRDAFEPEVAAYVERQLMAIDAERCQRRRIRRSVVTGLSALTIAATITAVTSLWQWREADVARKAADEQRAIATRERDAAEHARAAEAEQRVAAETESTRAKRQLYVSNLYKLQTMLDRPQRALAADCFRDSAASYREAFGGEAVEPFELSALRPELDLALAVHSGHERPITFIAFSPDGKRLATGSGDGTARLWDVATGAELATLEKHSDTVISASFSPDGVLLATGSSDHTARLWDVSSGKELAVLEGHGGPIHAIAFSPDGKRLVTGAGDRVARLWEVATGHGVAVLEGHGDGIVAVAFSPDGARLATGSDDNTARVWDAATGAELAILEGHEGRVGAIAFSPSGTHLATGSFDTTARLWDVPTWRESAVLRGHEKEVVSVAFSPHGRQVATGSLDDTARLWDAVTGEANEVLEGHEGDITAIAFSPDGTRLATGSYDHTARIWDVLSGRELAVLKGHADEITAVAFSPDGRHLATGSADTTARLWANSNEELVAVLDGHDGGVEAVAYNPAGTRLASGGLDHTARLWDPLTGVEVAVLKGHERSINAVAFSPDGTRLATGSSDSTVRFWDALTGAAISVLGGYESRIQAVAFSPDGKLLATCGDKRIRLRDPSSGTSVAVLEGHAHYVKSIAFSPDGKRLVTGSDDKTARLWDTSTGKTLMILEGHGGSVQSVAFSPDGKLLATGSSDTTGRLWDASTGRLIAALEGHEAGIRAVSFSADGKRLATGSRDHTARLWDTSSGAELAVLKGHEQRITSIAFSPDGKHLATGSKDKTVRLWGLTNAAIHSNRSAAASAANRLAAIVDECFDGAADDETVKSRFLAATATMPEADSVAAANLLLIKATARRDASAAVIQRRLEPLVDTWLDGITFPTPDFAQSRFAMAETELPADDYAALVQLVNERSTRIRAEFWTAVRRNTAESVALFTNAVESNSDDPVVLNELGWGVEVEIADGLVVSPRLLNAAVAAARRSVELQPGEANHFETLAHLLARQGRHEEALAMQRKAFELAIPERRAGIAPFLEDLEKKATLDHPAPPAP